MQVWWMAEDKPEPQGAASSWFPPLQAPAGEENNLGGKTAVSSCLKQHHLSVEMRDDKQVLGLILAR